MEFYDTTGILMFPCVTCICDILDNQIFIHNLPLRTLEVGCYTEHLQSNSVVQLCEVHTVNIYSPMIIKDSDYI